MVAAERIFAPKKIWRFTGYAACWLLCLAGLVVALRLSTSPHKNYASKKAGAKERLTAAPSAEARKIYPLSVIGGGAYSAEELNRARRLDPVVRAHYANFGKNPVVRRTPADLFMYVSYRKSDVVYWTGTKRRIPKGEPVLSDGENSARARCGNRLSFTPQQPIDSKKELPEEAFNTPETPKVSIPFDTPLPPATEADLYVPAGPLLADLFSPLLPSSPSFHTGASAGTSGAYLPMPGWGAGSPPGGSPLLLRGAGLPSQAGTAGAAGPGTIFAVPLVVSTPEPATAELLLLPILIFALPLLSRRMHFRR